MQRLALTFAGLALLTGISGYALTRCAIGISQQTGLSQTATGGLLTAVVTSLPELVTSIAAVRRGALTLAVGGIIGGNAFDVPFLAFADVAYRQGSLYEALNPAHLFAVAVSILMTGVLVMGLLKRERQGPAHRLRESADPDLVRRRGDHVGGYLRRVASVTPAELHTYLVLVRPPLLPIDGVNWGTTFRALRFRDRRVAAAPTFHHSNDGEDNMTHTSTLIKAAVLAAPLSLAALHAQAADIVGTL